MPARSTHTFSRNKYYDQTALVVVIVVAVEYTANGLHRTKNLYLSPKTPNTHRTSTAPPPYKHQTSTVRYGAFWGLCNIFENAFLRTNFAKTSLFPVLFQKLLVTFQELVCFYALLQYVQVVLCCTVHRVNVRHVYDLIFILSTKF